MIQASVSLPVIIILIGIVVQFAIFIRSFFDKNQFGEQCRRIDVPQKEE